MAKRKPAATTATTAGCTCMRLRKAARRVSQIYDHQLERYGLTVTQYGVLAVLRARSGIAMGQLAERLVMDPTTLTRNLQPLVRRALVAVAPDGADRRARTLTLTPAGLRALESARPGWQAAQSRVDAALGGEENVQLAAAIDRLLERLDA